VFPFIDKHYRTKNYRILIGPQAGANFGLYTLFEHPEIFNACIINNPFRWQGRRELILSKADDFLDRHSVFKKFVFITYNDTDPLAREGIGYLNRFSEITKTKNPEGFSLTLNFIAGNDEFLQRLGLREGFKKLFEDYPFPENRKVEGLDDVLSFYRELSVRYGFEVDPPEHVLTVQGDRLMEHGNINAVMDILRYTMVRYPDAANSYFRMANILLREGELEEARTYLQKTLERVPFDNGMIRSRLEQLETQINKSAAFQVGKVIRLSGIVAGIKKFRELKNSAQSHYYFNEGEFNELGYRLMQAKMLTEALEIFNINVELYPESANVYDSLGECYLKAGNQEKAIENYKKSLEFNPENKNASEMLKKLGH
jgi:tetratricopeptide (TPR) repeat protein